MIYEKDLEINNFITNFLTEENCLNTNIPCNYNKLNILIFKEFNKDFTRDALYKRVQRIKSKLNKYNDLNTKNNFDSLHLDTITFEENGNLGEVNFKSKTNPKTLAELLELCNVDSDIWDVEKYSVNKWEVAMNVNNKIVNTPLYQVKAFLIRKIPVKQSIPIVQPVSIEITERIYKPTLKKNIEKILIIPDSHNGYRRDQQTHKLIPLHDRDAWDLICQVIKQTEFDRIVLLGDMLDLAEWSDKFSKTPDFYFATQPALIELAWWLGKLRELSITNVEIDYLEGNHEQRMKRMMMNNLLAAYELKSVDNLDLPVMSIENLLGLKKLNIKYHSDYPNDEIWLNDNLCCTHGNVVRNGSGDTVKSIVQNARCSEIFGHIHRMEMACATKFSKKGPVSYKAFSPGTIARIDGVVPANKGKNNWQQGFAVVDCEPGNGLFEITPVTINNGSCIYNGKVFKSNFHIKDLIEDTKFHEFSR